MKISSKSILYSLAAVFFWSTSATAFKLSLRGMDYVQLVFYSSLMSAVVLFILIIAVGKFSPGSIFKNSLPKSLLLGLLNPFLYYLVLFKAYSLLQAQEAMVLNYTWPIMVSIFAGIFLKHKISAKIIIGLTAAFFGVIIIATHGDIFTMKFNNVFGFALAAGSSIIWAAFWIINLKDDRDPSIKLFSAFFFGTIFTAAYILLFDSFSPVNSNSFWGAGYIGVFEMSIGFFLWLKGLQLSPNKAKSSTLAYLAPFISLLLISIVLGEKIYLSSVFGLMLIIGGILYQQFSTRDE
ncbi:MAG: DMT family transporter [bacterium]